MAKIPVYQPTTNPSVPSAGPMTNPGTAAMQGKAMQGVGQGLGQVGQDLLQLQEKRNARVRSIKALDLSTAYSQKVNDITVKRMELEGSQAIGAFKAHQKDLADAAKEMDSQIDDELVREAFDAHRAQIDESSLGRIAAHESQQTRVAGDQALDNFIKMQSEQITANPNADQVGKSMAAIGAEIDKLQYAPEKALAKKAAADTVIKSNFLISLGEKQPQVALTYLEDWKKSGTIGAQDYITLKTHLEKKGDDVALDVWDKAMQGVSPFRAIDIVSDPARRDAFAKKHGIEALTLKQAASLSSVFENRARWQDYQERQARADQGEADFKSALGLLQKGDVAGAEKVVMNSPWMPGTYRSWITGYTKQIAAEQISTKAAQVFQDIDRNVITSPEHLMAVLQPLYNSGGTGPEVANRIKTYFGGRRADDAANYSLADRLYKNALANGNPMQFESKPVDFLVYLRDTCTAEGIHGDAIVKKAQELIGYVEEVSWGRDKIKSTYRKMEQEGTAGPKAQKGAAPAAKPGAGKTTKAPQEADLVQDKDITEASNFVRKAKNRKEAVENLAKLSKAGWSDADLAIIAKDTGWE